MHTIICRILLLYIQKRHVVSNTPVYLPQGACYVLPNKIKCNPWTRRAWPAQPTPCGFAMLRGTRNKQSRKNWRKTVRFYDKGESPTLHNPVSSPISHPAFSSRLQSPYWVCRTSPSRRARLSRSAACISPPP